MNLKLYFRAITTHMFQPRFLSGAKNLFGEPMRYEGSHFSMMRIFAKDGFSVSLQLNPFNYCSSEKGYREFGFDWEDVEFGCSSSHDKDLDLYAECSGDTTQNVGRVPVDAMQKIFDNNHGGIDWERTLSMQNCMKFHGIDPKKEFHRIR
jgi:hypothetical protein